VVAGLAVCALTTSLMVQATTRADADPPPQAAAAGPGAVDPDHSSPRLPDPASLTPYDDPALARVAGRVKAGKQVSSRLTVVRGDRVRVEVLARPGAGVRARAAIRAVQGRVVAGFRGTLLADVPVDRLLALQRRPGVLTVRLPLGLGDPAGAPADVLSAKVGAKGVDAANQVGATAWQAVGLNGSGIKVGVIDSFNAAKWQAAAASGDLPAGPDGAFCMWNGANCSSSFWNGGDHGVAVSEVIKDIAPNAGLYLATINSVTDYAAALAWFKSQGVQIISRSQVSPYDGPGNGTGPMDSVVDSAVSQGMTWFNAAGNSAGSATTEGAYFRTGWSDTDGDGWLNFPNGSEYLNFVCNPDGFLFLGLRWSDWGTARTDYDLYLYDNQGESPYASYLLDQAAGQNPIEGAGAQITGCGTNDVDYLAINVAQLGGGTAGDVLELMFNRSFVFPWNNAYSANSPVADSANPGMATIGAVDPPGGGQIATYSSQGPTNDGRIKPDLSAVAGMTSVTYGKFSGTSAATPAAAAAAALVLQSNPALTPAQLVATMKSYVTDRGAAGPDNVFGTGELLLPAPAAPPPSSPGVSVTSSLVLPVLNTLKTKFPVQVRWKTSGTQSQATVWKSLNGGAYTQGAAVGSQHKVRLKMTNGKTNRFAIRAVDPAGTQSAWYYTRAFHPRVLDDKDRKVKYSRGWRHFRQSGAWKGTLSSSGGTTGSVRMRFRGSAVSMAVFRSANSGKVRVYIDGKPKAKLTLRSNHVQARRVVFTYAFATKGKHTIEVQPLTSGPKGLVFLDGFLVLG